MQKIGRVPWLFDFYGELLTKKQQDVFKLYYFQDLSLAEIAENQGSSRQAVYDIIKRTEDLLIEYENKLKLYNKYLFQKKKMEEIKKILLDLEQNYSNLLVQKALKNFEELMKITCD